MFYEKVFKQKPFRRLQPQPAAVFLTAPGPPAVLFPYHCIGRKVCGMNFLKTQIFTNKSLATYGECWHCTARRGRSAVPLKFSWQFWYKDISAPPSNNFQAAGSHIIITRQSPVQTGQKQRWRAGTAFKYAVAFPEERQFIIVTIDYQLLSMLEDDAAGSRQLNWQDAAEKENDISC